MHLVEKIADRVLLLNKGKKFIEGSVDKIKREYSTDGFKVKEQLVTILVFGVLSLLIFGGINLLKCSPGSEIKLIVINSKLLTLKLKDESSAYQFVAIIGDKQLRITEVIVSAISPQKWIDGKILGISILSLVLLGTMICLNYCFLESTPKK